MEKMRLNKTGYSFVNRVAQLSVVATFAFTAQLPFAPEAKAGSCCGCAACASRAISRAEGKSRTAFAKLHSSIFELGSVFLAKSNEFSQAIYASSDNITTQIDVGNRVQKQMLVALNEKQEIRSQQKATLNRKRVLEETYNPDTAAQNLMLAYASQEEFTASDYEKFLGAHRDVYTGLVKQKRDTLLSHYVVSAESMKEVEPLLWQGEVQTVEEGANLLFLTQQILFGGDPDPFNELFDTGIEQLDLTRDEAAFESNRIVWANRIKPSIDFFTLDQGLRTRPSEEIDSVMGWLDQNIGETLYSAEGTAQMYAQGSRSDLYEALAIEQKKLNLVRYLNLSVNQVKERLSSANYAFNTDKEAKSLRYQTVRKDFHESSQGGN